MRSVAVGALVLVVLLLAVDGVVQAQQQQLEDTTVYNVGAQTEMQVMQALAGSGEEQLFLQEEEDGDAGGHIVDVVVCFFCGGVLVLVGVLVWCTCVCLSVCELHLVFLVLVLGLPVSGMFFVGGRGGCHSACGTNIACVCVYMSLFSVVGLTMVRSA